MEKLLDKEILTSLIRDFAYISVDKVKKSETLIFLDIINIGL